MASGVPEEPDRLVVSEHRAIVGLHEVPLVLHLVFMDSSRFGKLLLLAICQHELTTMLISAILQLQLVDDDLFSIVRWSDPLSVDVLVVAMADDLT